MILKQDSKDPNLGGKLINVVQVKGSPNTSPVLNLSKNASGGSAGSPVDGDHSGSEPDVPPSPHSPTHSVPDDDDDDNISDPDDDDEKDQDLDDGDLPLPTAPGSDSQHTALNYSTLASAVASVNGPGQDAAISSTETLLRNIQGLLKVAAENARQQERQINYEKAELKMDVLREREVKDSLERQLADEQKIRVLMQKRLRRERRDRRRLQDQIDVEIKRRAQLEDALKAAGAGDQIRIINEKLAQQNEQQRTSGGVGNRTTASSTNHAVTNERGGDRTEQQQHASAAEKERVESPASAYNQNVREPPPPPPPDVKPWGYAGIDLMNTGAAFWQNYSESLAQELEMERKSRHQQVERDVKSPLQERSNYYKNSVLFTSTAT
ncbi:dachshund homolog 2-like [Photinus pyralis]|nr:dachshund homolog 2-like [Photinus pyralis]